jgi:hypothetical protein
MGLTLNVRIDCHRVKSNAAQGANARLQPSSVRIEPAASLVVEAQRPASMTSSWSLRLMRNTVAASVLILASLGRSSVSRRRLIPRAVREQANRREIRHF